MDLLEAKVRDFIQKGLSCKVDNDVTVCFIMISSIK